MDISGHLVHAVLQEGPVEELVKRVALGFGHRLARRRGPVGDDIVDLFFGAPSFLGHPALELRDTAAVVLAIPNCREPVHVGGHLGRQQWHAVAVVEGDSVVVYRDGQA